MPKKWRGFNLTIQLKKKIKGIHHTPITSVILCIYTQFGYDVENNIIIIINTNPYGLSNKNMILNNESFLGIYLHCWVIFQITFVNKSNI